MVNSATTGRLIVSKGFTRNCIGESSPNLHVYCCQYNLCNTSNGLFPSKRLVTAIFLIIFFFALL